MCRLASSARSARFVGQIASSAKAVLARLRRPLQRDFLQSFWSSSVTAPLCRKAQEMLLSRRCEDSGKPRVSHASRH